MVRTNFLDGMATAPDLDPADTYAGVGRVLSAWERVEFNLARLYSSFVGFRNDEAVAQYGAGRIYRERLEILKRAANNHFITHCDQKWEGEFDHLCSDCDALSALRNDIAHGLVMDVSGITHFRTMLALTDEASKFLLLPPLYLGSRHLAVGGPSFFYSSASLDQIVSELLDQGSRIVSFRVSCPSLAAPR